MLDWQGALLLMRSVSDGAEKERVHGEMITIDVKFMMHDLQKVLVCEW